jgi:peptidoglycan hydrolase-like protein with peptidoglycan-binding domain
MDIDDTILHDPWMVRVVRQSPLSLTRLLGGGLLRALGGSPRDAFGLLLVAGLSGAILVNALYLQPGPHPSPIFTIRPRPVTTEPVGSVAVPRPRPAEAARTDPAPARPRAEIITDIQRALARHGFYDGPVDGVHGSRTDTAIRDFMQAAGGKWAGEPNEELLRTITRSPLMKGTAAQHAATPGHSDPIGELIAPSPRRVLAVQRALADYGYGPLKPNGTLGAETRAAIEKFERDRKLPVTGQISDRLVRELAAATGRPLD